MDRPTPSNQGRMTPRFRLGRRQHGQAIVELAAVAGGVLVLLFLAMAMLGRLSDVRAKTLMAGRYAAWERTVYLDDAGWNKYGISRTKQPEAIRSEMVQRVLGHDDPKLHADDGTRAALPAGGTPMWHDIAGGNLLANYGDVRLNTSNGTTGTPLDTAVSVLDAGGAIGVGFDLPTSNQQTAQVSLSVANSSQTLRQLWPGWSGFTASDTHVLLTNGWTPDGSSGTLAQVSNATPVKQAGFAGGLALDALALFAPDILGLDLGKIAPDVVPADRLGQ